MYVCVCMAVTEAEVASAIDELDPRNVSREAVTRACGAGADCGACHGMIDNMLEDRLETAAESGPQLVPACALVRPTRAA